MSKYKIYELWYAVADRLIDGIAEFADWLETVLRR